MKTIESYRYRIEEFRGIVSDGDFSCTDGLLVLIAEMLTDMLEAFSAAMRKAGAK